MFLLALSRGQGSTIWVTIFVADALPPFSVIVSRWSRYSEQPASTPASASPNEIAVLMDGRIGNPHRFGQIEDVTGERLLLRFRDLLELGRQCLRFRTREFGLPQKEEVDIVGRQRVVGRRLYHVARSRGANDMRREDDRKVGLILLIGFRGKQRAQCRDAAEPRKLLDLVVVVGLQQ